jgi:hypothetical protein
VSSVPLRVIGPEARSAGASGAGDGPPADRPPTGRLVWLPLGAALAWMLGTFGAFWLGDLADEVPNPGQLCLFVLGATGVFALGYILRVRRVRRLPEPQADPPSRVRLARRVVLACSVYHTAFGLAHLAEFGATGPGSVWASVQDPAGGYENKLALYDVQRVTGQSDVILFGLSLLGVLSMALAPLLIVYWRQLTIGPRVAGLVGLAMEAAFWVYVGTKKGLGDTAVMLVAGLMIVTVAARRRRMTRPAGPARRARSPVLLVATGIVLLFSLYMVYNQTARASHVGSAGIVRPDPVFESVVGYDISVGVATTVFYPTHGYLGLAYNLETPFEWSRGLGSSVTMTSYAKRFLGADPEAYPSYPERTEWRTGWPAWMYWATIYPWLASDLTYPGAALFMGLVGWLLAHTWIEAAYTRRILSMLIFAQLCLLVAYVPANNQLGLTLRSTAGVATLVAIYAGRLLLRGADRPDGRRAGARTESRNAPSGSA